MGLVVVFGGEMIDFFVVQCVFDCDFNFFKIVQNIEFCQGDIINVVCYYCLFYEYCIELVVVVILVCYCFEFVVFFF